MPVCQEPERKLMWESQRKAFFKYQCNLLLPSLMELHNQEQIMAKPRASVIKARDGVCREHKK